MAKTGQPIKVAILGGGMGALATAFEISAQPDYEVTIYTLGWRLGGKCASSRGPNDRIEEHGIHGFLGSYFNACPMLAEVYAELGRSPDAPIATFDDAMVGMDALQMYSYMDGAPKRFASSFPPDTEFPDPSKPIGVITVDLLIARVIAFFERAHAAAPNAHTGFLRSIFDRAIDVIAAAGSTSEASLSAALAPLVEEAYDGLCQTKCTAR